MPEKGLGAGLGALFGDDILLDNGENLLSIPISKIEPRSDQPRMLFDPEALNELAESLKRYGLIQPLTVRKLDSGYYQIIAGERRWRAARIAGLDEVPVRVLDADDRRVAEIALVENLQREDLNPLEEARGYRALITDYGMTQEDAAQSVGKSRPAITNSLRLLTLSEGVQKLVEDGKLSAGHARAILPISDSDEQIKAANKIISDALSVRQTEALVSKLTKAAKESSPKPKTNAIHVNYFAEVESGLEEALGRKVRIDGGKRTGKIELEYYGMDDLGLLVEGLYAMTGLRRND